MLLLTVMKKTAIFIILSLVCLSAFGQDYVNPSYRQGFSFEVESGYADNGGYFDISSGCNIIHGLYVGLGGGYERHDFDGKLHTMVPAFIQARYSFLDKVVSPFFDFKVGVLTDFSDQAVGHFFRPAIGVEYRHLGVKVGYDWAQIENSGFSDDMCTIGVFYRF